MRVTSSIKEIERGFLGLKLKEGEMLYKRVLPKQSDSIFWSG